MADSGSCAAIAEHRHRARARPRPVRKATGRLPSRQVRQRGCRGRGARAARTREIHHLPTGIDPRSGPFGRRAAASAQGSRDRAAGAAHLASIARRPRFLRRVRCERARSAHPAADPVANGRRRPRFAPDPRRAGRLAGDIVQWAGIGVSSTGPVAASAAPNPLEDGIPFCTKLAGLAQDKPDDTGVTIVALDGTTESLTFSELDAGANQWGRALAAGGAELGCFVALAIPNSRHLVLATLGCWKIGAVPIPMHWDLPAWERDRVRTVIDPTVVVDETSRWELDARAA